MFPRTILKVICFMLIAILMVSADLYATSDEYSQFVTAIDNDDLNAIQTLIDSGADVNAKGDSDLTPLFYAVSSADDSDIIEALIAAGADVEAEIEIGWTPLMFAAELSDNPDILLILSNVIGNPFCIK